MHYKLGMFSPEGGKPFPGLIIEREPRAGHSPASGSPVPSVVPLSRLEPLWPRLGTRLSHATSLMPLLDSWDESVQALAHICDSFTGELASLSLSFEHLRVHAPLQPRQVFCMIGNYRSQLVETIVDAGAPPHTDGMSAEERRSYAAATIEERLRGAPYACLKLPSAVSGPQDDLAIPRHARRVDWEVELGVVIGRSCRRVGRADAMKQVAGYVLVNDITARDLVRRPDLPHLGTDWLQSKSAPGFLPMGPYFVPAAFIPDPYALRLSLALNGQPMQDELVADMLFDIAAQIESLSFHAQLLPGDLICTGTPAGCGTHSNRFLQAGDVMEASSPGLGTQRIPCL